MLTKFNTVSTATIISVCFFAVEKISSQTNLVYNPGFEVYDTCPSSLYQLTATGWKGFCATPDYYNACNNNISPYPMVGIPANGQGRQAAVEGFAYMGLFSLSLDGIDPQNRYREVIGSQLIQDMEIGKRYYLSMKVSLAETPSTANEFHYTPCNNIGMKFSKVTYTTNEYLGNLTYPFINNSAHLYSKDIISDTTNWTLIQGSFIADSAYRYIMIGNFFDNANTDTINRVWQYGYGDSYGGLSYFYVDDIIVSTDSTIITSVQKQKIESSVSVFPNPANDYLSLHSDLNEIHTATIFNMYGQEQQRTNFLLDSKWNIASLSEGIYYLKIESSNGTLLQKIIVKR